MGRPKRPAAPEPAISLEEAKRRGLWAIYRIRKGHYVCYPAGPPPAQGEFVGWAKDEDSARRACTERGRDDRHPFAKRRLDEEGQPDTDRRAVDGGAHARD